MEAANRVSGNKITGRKCDWRKKQEKSPNTGGNEVKS